MLSVELRQLYGLKLPRLLGFRDDLTPPIVAIHMLEDAPLAIVQVRRTADTFEWQ